MYNAEELVGVHEKIMFLCNVASLLPDMYADIVCRVLHLGEKLRYLTEIEECTKEVAQELLDNPEISKALTVVEESAYTEAQMAAYDKFWDIIRTERTYYNSAHRDGFKEGHDAGLEAGYKKGEEKGIKEGIEKGIKEGIEKGIKEGIEKGIQEGIKEGLEKEKHETINRLKSKGFDIATIAIATDLSEEEVMRYI